MYTSTWVKDTAERVLATFAEAALGLWILAGPADVFHMSTAHGAAAAGLIAGAAVLKAAVASKVGNPSSASLNPDLAVVETPKAVN